MTPWTKRLALLLAISVGVNLLLAGFWIGRRFGGPPPRAFDAGESFELGRGARRHPVLRSALDRHRDEFHDRREATRRARARAREVLTSSEFDRQKLEQALAGLKDEMSKNQELAHRALVEAAVEARPEQRKALGVALGPKGPRDRKGRGRDD
jgi:uncharacterized membrane protein